MPTYTNSFSTYIDSSTAVGTPGYINPDIELKKKIEKEKANLEKMMQEHLKEQNSFNTEEIKKSTSLVKSCIIKKAFEGTNPNCEDKFISAEITWIPQLKHSHISILGVTGLPSTEVKFIATNKIVIKLHRDYTFDVAGNEIYIGYNGLKKFKRLSSKGQATALRQAIVEYNNANSAGCVVGYMGIEASREIICPKFD